MTVPTLVHKGVTYYGVPDKGMCYGCALEKLKRTEPCPVLRGFAACTDHTFKKNGMSSILVTEDEYLKRRLRGEV